MSFFDCKPCHKISECAELGCLDVQLGGLVNKTSVCDPDEPANDAVMWNIRLQLQNCSGRALCVSLASLALRWKFKFAAGNSVFQIIPALERYSIESNLPGFARVDFWSGTGAESLLNKNNFILPPGQHFIEITIQILQSTIKESFTGADCTELNLFPSPFTVVLRSTHNSGSNQTFTVDVGCSPDTVSVNDGQLIG